MANKDWFRNKDWNPEIEASFFKKLGCARNKAQYLRIQAGHLVHRHPRTALALLDKYFAFADHFDQAQALLDQANAYCTLGAVPNAIQSLQKSLQREREFPRLKTQAWSRYALLVATEGIEPLYDDALRVLQENTPNATSFPVDHFLWNAAQALIADAKGMGRVAKEYSTRAHQFSEVTHSGFRYHPEVGLVGNQYESLNAKLRALALK